jgi:CYTH domain-containing protein
MEEIELTYLAKTFPEGIENAPRKEMLDIYIPAAAEHPVLRIRSRGEKYEITKKEPIHGSDSSHQLETTIPLSKEELEELSQLKGKRTRKTRCFYEENGTHYEVDIFREGLAGLVLVDIEFASLEEKKKFIPPEWCLAEVTQEKFLAGGMVCGKRYGDLEPQLARFGYKPLASVF